MTSDRLLSRDVFAGAPIAVSPTDVAQFIRLDQCRRFLRLRLHEAREGGRFLRAAGVVPQEAPPLLTRSGVDFEADANRQVRASLTTRAFSAEERRQVGRTDDNAALIVIAQQLENGTSLCLMQPRLQTVLAGWRISGDLDLLRLDRDETGRLHALIADVKSSASSKVEHRLQLAFYHELIRTLLAEGDVSLEDIRLAVIYRGDSGEDGTPDSTEILIARQEAAKREFGIDSALFEEIEEPQTYVAAIHDLITGPQSTARETIAAEFDEIPFHLTYKCDWCRYNAYCTKSCAEQDDLSLIPYLTDGDKRAFRRAGITTTVQLAGLKTPGPAGSSGPDLVPTADTQDLVSRLGATWPVGPRIDELVHRARRYRRFKGDDIQSRSEIPHQGHGSLPYCDAEHNPNLVKVFIDGQHDYLTDRIYLLGSLVVAAEAGIETAERRRSIVHLAPGPATEATEAKLFEGWLDETIAAIVELAAADASAAAKAPIHLIFFNRFDQRLLLQGLGRHATAILGATPLYDFVTQLAAFDSPIATFLVDEIRELKNYPMVCQSLQAVSRYLKFDWNAPEQFAVLFRTGLFDHLGRFDSKEQPAVDASPWYTARSRFNSQIPLEYAYAAWNQLADPDEQGLDKFRAYRGVSAELLRAFQARRLDALEWIAKDFNGNKLTEKRSFDLPRLGEFTDKAATLADALDEFVVIERHVELSGWKGARHASPERRVLSGETLLLRFDEQDQDSETRERNRANLQRQKLREDYERDYWEAHPDALKVNLPKDQKDASKWSQDGLRFRLRVDVTDVDCGLDEALNMNTLKEGDSVIVFPRWTTDGRLPIAQQKPFPPTPKQMLYGTRARIVKIHRERDPDGRTAEAWVEIEMASGMGAGQGFLFGAFSKPLVPGEQYTIDEDPNSIYGFWCKKVTEGLVEGGENALYARLIEPANQTAEWSAAAAAGQRQFLAGLDALHDAGVMHEFEPSKRTFIADHGGSPTLLVQGPPGTGKSYSTAFALLARMQGAMAVGRDFRVFLSCKTHAATDVLARNVLEVQHDLRVAARRHPEAVKGLIDARLYDVDLYRLQPRNDAPLGAIALSNKSGGKDSVRPTDRILSDRWCFIAATPGATYGLIKNRWSGDLFGHDICDCLVLDEASQMNLPEAIMAALPLRSDGQLIVVGDHRQMPPIVKHDWLGETRRTFREFKSYQSLFNALRELSPPPPMIQFARSFRLHADVAAFLRDEIYRHDGIDYHSLRTYTLPERHDPDPFVAAVLSSGHPLTVVVHDEAESQHANLFERDLLAPVLETLTDIARYRDEDNAGYGVVVPHRAQRSALRETLDALTLRFPASTIARGATVDTVERFQGDERTVIIVSATESDHEYLVAASDFLIDPRRLTVALSRAKEKLILVASRSVFSLLSGDEDAFANAQLWKNLLRKTCTTLVWEGERLGHHVQVWGNTR